MKHKFLFGAALALSLSAMQAASCFAAGFVTTPQGVKYQWGDGSYCYNNWVQVRDHWFYFGNDQLMRTGWIQRDNTWYFAADTGELQAGAVKINGNVYYFDKQTCKMITGYQPYDFDIYEFTENGTVGKTPYIFTEWNSDGTLRSGVRERSVR